MKDMIESFQQYVASYEEINPGWEKYSDETFLLDMVYGLGLALNPEEHRYSAGFSKFIVELRPLLDRQLPKKVWGDNDKE